MAGHRRSRLRAGVYLGEKAAPYAAPWLIALSAMPVATLIHFTIGQDVRWMMIISVIFAFMVLGTWQTWKHRRHETRVTATLLSAALLSWTALSGTAVPWRGDMLRAWVVAGVCGSVFWMIRHAGTTAGHDKDTASAQTDWLGDKIAAFKNSRTPKGSVRETPDELRFRTTLAAPTTASEAQRSREQIAAVAGVGADQVNVLKVPGHEGQADVVLTRRQDTSRPLAYRGPSAPGQSIAAAPLWLGKRTDGSDIAWWIVGDPGTDRPLAHTKCTGVTGSGKTDTICTAILDMRWRTDVVPVVADPAKFRQGFGDIEECLALAATTQDQTKQLISNLGPVIEYRADLLGRLERADGGTGYKQWVPECWTLHRIPAVFLDIEEAADVAMQMDEELDEAVRKLRSIGIHLVLSMQTMPFDNLPRKARGQFGQSLAHGQNEYMDAKFALNAKTLDAGADPTQWGPNIPGSLYAEMTGTDDVHWPIGGRVVKMTDDQKAWSLAESRPFWADLDPGTYERLAYGLNDDDQPVEQGEEDEEDAVAGVSGADPSVPLTPPSSGLDFVFGPPALAEMSTEDARARLMNRIEVLARSGQTDISFPDLDGIREETGMSPSWIYKQLGLLVEAGVLKEYRPPKPVMVDGKKVRVLWTIIRKYQAA